MGCEGCSRIILLVFNLIFFIIGAACLGVGIWVVVDASIFLQVLSKIPEDTSVYGSLIADAAYILIGAGAAIFLIAFFGCCGAWKKNKCMLIVYAIIVGVLVLMQIACLVTAYFFYDKVVVLVNTQLALALNASYTREFVPTATAGEFEYNGDGIFSKGIDAIQIEFACCGVANYTDYYNSEFPESCCPAEYSGKIEDLIKNLWDDKITTYTTTAPSCPNNITYLEDNNVPGCTDSIKNFIQSKSLIFIGIAAGTLAVQVFVFLFACCFISSIGEQDD